MRPIDADIIGKIFYTMSMCSSNEYCKAFNAGAERMFKEIQNAPTLDLVPTPVKCGECKYYGKNLGSTIDDKRCHLFPTVCYGHFVSEDFYCANSKRKDDAK